MNKFITTLASLALIFGATSCSQDEDAPKIKGIQSEVNLKVQAPEGFRTRAGQLYGAGATNALHLSYAIYRADGEIVYSSENAGDPVPVQTKTGEWDFSVKLMTEETYDFVFWADQFGDDEKNPYTLDINAGTLTVDYAKSMTVENLATDRADAYILFQDFTVGDATTFTMRRPFAQVNVGSNEDEIKNADGYYHNVTTSVGISYAADGNTGSLPNVLNYRTGKVTGANGHVNNAGTMVASSFDGKGYDYPVNPACQYMYMAYILAPQDASGWGDADANAANLHLNVTLGKAPFTGETRDPYRIADAKNWLVANSKIVIAPSCTDLEGEPDPDPDPDPNKPGFVEGTNLDIKVVYNSSFNPSTPIHVQ